jgi:hypothetical protein
VDDFLTVRFALDNVHPPELATRAREALERIIDGRAVAEPGSEDGRRYARRPQVSDSLHLWEGQHQAARQPRDAA